MYDKCGTISCDKCGCITVGSIVTIIFSVYTIIMFNEILLIGDIGTYICNITRVDYPATIPVIPNSKNWMLCSCDEHCFSWKPCIKLYSSIDPNLMLQDNYNDDYDCSIYYDCPCAHTSIEYYNKILNDSIINANSYLNSEIDCYYNNEKIDKIYMNKEIDMGLYIICGVSIVIICFGIICIMIGIKI